MGCGGQKRIALDSKKERFVRIKGFLHIKRRFLRTVKVVRMSGVLVAKTRGFSGQSVKLSANENFLIRDNGVFFSSCKAIR